MSILKYEEETMWELWPVIIAGVVIAYLALRMRETFVVKYGNPFDDEPILSFDRDAKGTRLFGIYPDTCPADRSELEAGLCYPPCEDGYHGVGPVCWADTTSIGIGTLAKISSCSEMGLGPDYRDDPLTCWKDLKCDTGSGWDFFRFDKWECTGPDLKGKTLSCPGSQPEWFGTSRDEQKLRTDLVDGLCYKPCPADAPRHVPLMPYLCFKGTQGLSYGRGAGTVPPLWQIGA